MSSNTAILTIFILIVNNGHISENVSEEKFGSNAEPEPNGGLSNDECVRRIYRDCNYPTVFTDEELENVRQYLNYSFTQLADIKPDKPLCPKLHVRQDWKCLSPQQRTRIINAWKIMYKRGDIQRLTDFHVKWWPAWHKSPEFIPAHRWILNEFEKSMRSIDPGLSLPYWNPFLYGVQPERSSVWEAIGHSGNYSNGYSVLDGPIYGELNLVPSLKRHWSPMGTIYPWFTNEVVTMSIQTSRTFADYTFILNGYHFQPHLNIGGYEGQEAHRDAPYDLIFYMQHNHDSCVSTLKNQLLYAENLTPRTYNASPVLNPTTGKLQPANLATDILNGVPWLPVREPFYVGFGDNCYIPDQFIRPINNIMRGIRDQIPTAVKRLMRLPRDVLQKYFPLFAQGNFTALSHSLEEVGDCNRMCIPLPNATYMRDTEQGRAQFEAYRFDAGFDASYVISVPEKELRGVWQALNQFGYCSPYLTTY